MNLDPYRVERIQGPEHDFFVLEFGEDAGGRIEASDLVKPKRLETLCNCAFRQGVLAEGRRTKDVFLVTYELEGESSRRRTGGIFDSEDKAKAAVQKSPWMIVPTIEVFRLNEVPWKRHWISFRGGQWEHVEET